jgi:hypothetical protein
MSSDSAEAATPLLVVTAHPGDFVWRAYPLEESFELSRRCVDVHRRLQRLPARHHHPGIATLA